MLLARGCLRPGAPGLCCWHVGTQEPRGAPAAAGQAQQSLQRSRGQSMMPITAPGLVGSQAGFLPTQ